MAQLGGKSFFQSNPDWETKPIMGLLSQHAREMHGQIILLHSEYMLIFKIDTVNTKIMTCGSTSRKPYVEIETDEDGHPLLPDRSEWPQKSMEKKSLIRSYVAVAYRTIRN